MSEEEKGQGRGRPSYHGERMKRITAVITERQKDYVMSLGDVFAVALRRIIDEHMEHIGENHDGAETRLDDTGQQLQDDA